MHNILIFGDSISTGKGVAKDKSWPVLLGKHFDKQNRYSPLVHNLSFPGESTKEVVKRFPFEVKTRVKKGSKTSVIFAVGINDAKCVEKETNPSTTEEVFKENIGFLIRSAQEYADDIAFVGLSSVDEKKTLPAGSIYFSNERIARYSHMIKDVCDESGVLFIDLEKDFNTNFLAEDGIHLNNLGHQMIADKVISLYLL